MLTMSSCTLFSFFLFFFGEDAAVGSATTAAAGSDDEAATASAATAFIAVTLATGFRLGQFLFRSDHARFVTPFALGRLWSLGLR